MNGPMIEFHLDAGSGLSPYQQLVRQVRQALRLGVLREGDQLPTVKDVVAHLAINPNMGLAPTPGDTARFWRRSGSSSPRRRTTASSDAKTNVRRFSARPPQRPLARRR
jgi:DNA-binding transcriptional MocR family regulator